MSAEERSTAGALPVKLRRGACGVPRSSLLIWLVPPPVVLLPSTRSPDSYPNRTRVSRKFSTEKSIAPRGLAPFQTTYMMALRSPVALAERACPGASQLRATRKVFPQGRRRASVIAMNSPTRKREEVATVLDGVALQGESYKFSHRLRSSSLRNHTPRTTTDAALNPGAVLSDGSLLFNFGLAAQEAGWKPAWDAACAPHLHCIGVGGIGMSGIARLALAQVRLAPLAVSRDP